MALQANDLKVWPSCGDAGSSGQQGTDTEAAIKGVSRELSSMIWTSSTEQAVTAKLAIFLPCNKKRYRQSLHVTETHFLPKAYIMSREPENEKES